MEKIVFVTGTDTGAGKTLATALLLCHSRQRAVHALAMKPFCSGGRADIELIQALQDDELSEREANPFYFSEPLAPLVSARKHRRRITLAEVMRKIQRIEKRCERLFIEGSGGLMVPLGEGYRVVDLIAKLHCLVLVVARNKLGTINHTVLTVEALQRSTRNRMKVLLMDGKPGELSAESNARIIRESLAPVEVLRVPFLGIHASQPGAVKKNCRKIKKVLALILE